MKYKLLLFILPVFFAGCHSVQWNSINTNGEKTGAPEEIQSIFSKYPDGTMILDANAPGFDYRYDIGEKDSVYGDTSFFQFRKISIDLHKEMPKGKVITDINFIDNKGNKVLIEAVDLLRLIPKFDAIGDAIYPEIIEEEFNRFGYTFRKEHNEFKIVLADPNSEELQRIENRAYRTQIVNNCLSPTKWEFVLTSEDYSDFDSRLRAPGNLNQNRILSHSWFYMDLELYSALIQLKNPTLNVDFNMDYAKLSNIAEDVVIDFSKLREPIKYRVNTKVLEFGYKTGRVIEPLDNEQFYKKEFKLLLEGSAQTYTSILEKPVETAQFKDAGFYNDTTPKKFDLNWMQHLDSVYVDVLDVKGSDSYVEITLSGQWTPYEITIGNIDLSLLSEQSLFGLLFGINTYPKNRRYNPVQTTLSYDADLLPNDIKPYVWLTDKKTGKWVNNQYKGIEKIYLTYESIERDVLNIYVLSYERILPVWMTRIELPKNIREKVRIRKGLYNY